MVCWAEIFYANSRGRISPGISFVTNFSAVGMVYDRVKIVAVSSLIREGEIALREWWKIQI